MVSCYSWFERESCSLNYSILKVWKKLYIIFFINILLCLYYIVLSKCTSTLFAFWKKDPSILSQYSMVPCYSWFEREYCSLNYCDLIFWKKYYIIFINILLQVQVPYTPFIEKNFVNCPVSQERMKISQNGLHHRDQGKILPQ